jgi:hypothetical protein
MTLTRKERIERAALAFFARHDDSIEDVVANAEFLIDAIDALPDEPDHIAEINARVDEVFGKPVEAANAAKKVELPGKWTAKDQWISFPDGRELAAPNEYVSHVVCKQHSADLDAAREYWFRAGIEAAATLVDTKPADASRAVTVAQIRAIPTPKID